MGTEFLKWSDNYSIGLQEIDNQHKKLLDIINKLYMAFTNREESVVMEDILAEMANYTNYHFGTEERYFSQFGYKDALDHLEQHKNYVAKLSMFQDDFKNNRKITYSVMNFLRNWLVNHIQGIDRDYVALFKENGVK